MSDKKRKRLWVNAPSAAFVIPYFEREFDGFEVVTEPDRPFDHAVMVSTTDIYNAAAGSGHDESTPELLSHPMRRAEDDFRRTCSENGVPPTVLRCPHIVGTGMTGLPREMVNKIWRGSFFHIKGVDEHLSVIHASDIAAAARATLDSGLTLIATDGADPSYDQLAEALSYRLGHKRIFTIGERWARFRYSSALYNILTNTLTYSSQKLQSEFGFTPTPVCQYLTTHIYDDDSL